MFKVIRAAERHFRDFGWLKTFWLFSFSDYYDPDNLGFGGLRVFNDDTVSPGEGFPMHPHRDMEIVTIVLEGEITHQDSLGNKVVIREGDVQRMSAGVGINHSELNLAGGPVHFFQIWVEPTVRGLKPSYAIRRFKPHYYYNRLLPVASGTMLPDTVKLTADATIYRADLEEGVKVEHKTERKRRTFIYLLVGDVEVNDKKLKSQDQARIDGETSVVLKPRKPTSLVLIDLPSDYGFGYDKKTLKGRAI